MKKEEVQKNIVGDSENDDRDNVISEPLRSAPSPPVATPVQASPPPPTPGTAPVQALVPRGGGANWVKAKDVIREDEVFEGPTKNVMKKQAGSPSHAIDIDASGTSSTELKKQDGSPSHAIDFDASGTSSTEPKKQDGPPSDAIYFDFDAYDDGARYDYTWIKDDLGGVKNSTLVHELKSYKLYCNTRPKKKILPVPTMLPRGIQGSHSDYDPKIVAIGPYHNPCYVKDNPELKRMEAIKIQFTLQYTDQSRKSIEKLYEEMEELLIGAKNYYDKDVIDAFDNKKFARMMFIDSCFRIQFMDSYMHPHENYIKITRIEKSLIMRDIMLLENQLPFKILTKLMSLSSRFEGDKGENMINKFIKLIVNESSIEEEAPKRKKMPIHLLELIQMKFFYYDELEILDDDEIVKRLRKLSSLNWRLYRSVKDLKAVGIYFRPSKTCHFSDIKFKSMCLCGRLQLPRIDINNGTKSLLLNLVAFETFDYRSNFGVSTYVWFMDRLIDQAEDVRELQSEGIILNFLSSDDEVVKLFNEISEHVTPNSLIFWNVMDSLDDFYNSRIRLWLTEFLHRHFRSPWAIIAFIAAIAVLGLTITQTVFSAIQL